MRALKLLDPRTWGLVDVTGCEGPVVGAWEFPDPVMQADADQRRRIAELEEENRQLLKQVSDLEMRAVAWDQIEDGRKRNEGLRLIIKREFDERVQRAVKHRTLDLRVEIRRHQQELARMVKKKAAA